LHGCFLYQAKRLKTGHGGGGFFSQTDYFGHLPGKRASYESKGLIAFAVKYAAFLSYAATAGLVAETCGGSVFSAQHIHGLVAAKAAAVTASQKEKIAFFESSGLVLQAKKTDIYDSAGEEIVYFTDDVCVKKQKQKRDKQDRPVSETKRHDTRVSLFQAPGQGYKPIVAGFGVDNASLVKALFCETYAEKAASLPIVAVTDGATGIKNELKLIFGDGFTHILDWYHLQKKVHGAMTMISVKADREFYCKDMLALLWKGESLETIAYLDGITPKNGAAKSMLITYLTKNQATIVDYGRRREAGKTIGSGRVEKQNDILVAKRQKYNGMSWSPKGATAMTLNTASYL
jgi:hypothetical protein